MYLHISITYLYLYLNLFGILLYYNPNLKSILTLGLLGPGGTAFIKVYILSPEFVESETKHYLINISTKAVTKQPKMILAYIELDG